jgi:hypothetical protein
MDCASAWTRDRPSSARSGTPRVSTSSSRLVSLSEASSQKKRLSAQGGNPFSVTGGEPGEDLRHDCSE